MEIMPHVKALLDDLISITKNIVVKQSDLALLAENEVTEQNYYYQFKRIIDNEEDFEMYETIPEEVLSSIGKWSIMYQNVETNEFIGTVNNKYPELDDVQNIVTSIYNNNIVAVYNNKAPTVDDNLTYNNNIGDKWYNVLKRNEYDAINKGRQTTINIKLVYRNKNTNEIIFSGNVGTLEIEFKPTVFICDNKINELWTNDEDIPDHMKYREIKVNPDNSFVTFGSIDTVNMKQCKDDTGNYIKFSYNNLYDRYVKDDTGAHVQQYSNKYISYNEDVSDTVYFKSNDNTPMNNTFRYSRDDNLSYYKIMIEDEPNYINIESDSDFEFYGIDKNTADIYYKYTDKYANYIDLNEKCTILGLERNRFGSLDNPDNIFFYFDGTNYIPIDISLIEENEVISEGQYVYYKQDDNGDYMKLTTSSGNTYIKISDTYVEPNLRYSEYLANANDVYNNSIITYTVDIYYFYNLYTEEQIPSIVNNKFLIAEEDRYLIMYYMRNYVIGNYCPEYKNPQYKITRYDGEKNDYYRKLNGLPPIHTSIDQPTVDMYLLYNDYSGEDHIKYVSDLTDKEIAMLENNGMLDTIKESYPHCEYLWYLGENRIDVIEAREAAPFDILRHGEYDNENSYTMLLENYNKSKNYILNKYYNPEIYDSEIYYCTYIGLLILVNAMKMTISNSGDLLIKGKFYDYETVQLILEENGFKNTFDNIPDLYRRNIARNIELLIRNKGIDDLYKIIYKIFNINDVEVYEYYFKKILDLETGEYDLSIAQASIESENPIKDISNDDNKINYDTVTQSDKYWGVYDSYETVKNYLLNYDFNYMNSKYITVNSKFSLQELTFTLCYLLNYLLDTANNSINVKIEGYENQYSLESTIVALFYIQCLRAGLKGLIPNDIVGVSAIARFNMDENLSSDMVQLINDSIEKLPLLLNGITYIKSNTTNGNYYRTEDDISNSTYNNYTIDIDYSKHNNASNFANLISSSSIVDIPEIITMNDLCNGYLNTIAFTNINMDKSIIDRINNISPHISKEEISMYRNLLKLLTITTMTNEVYNLGTEKYELIYDKLYDNEKDDYSEKWYYSDFKYVWMKVKSINTSFFEDKLSDLGELNNDIKISSKTPIYDAYSLNVSSTNYIIVNKQNVTVDKINEIFKDISINWDNSEYADQLNDLFTVYKKCSLLDPFTEDYAGTEFIDGSTIDIGVDDIDNHTGTGDYYYQKTTDVLGKTINRLYKKTSIALSYGMYVREFAPELYNEIQKNDSETPSDYSDRLNSLYSTIVLSIESLITKSDLSQKVNLTSIDFTNIVKYIRIVIDVFKSSTIDLASMDVIYSLDEKNQNSIIATDEIVFSKDNSYFDDRSLVYDSQSIEESNFMKSKLSISDEIVIIEKED